MSPRHAVPEPPEPPQRPVQRVQRVQRVQPAQAEPYVQYTQPGPAVQYAAPEPAVQYAAPEPAVRYAAPQPAVRYTAPQPAVQYAQPEPAVQYTAPQPSPVYPQSEPTAQYAQPAPRAAAAPGPIAAGAAGVTKVYGAGDTAVHALRGVDIAFPAGEFTAIMGPSGSGKSTLMHCLAGLDTPSAGRVVIGDTELTGLSDKAMTVLRRDRIGFVFQSFNLVPTLTARENITLPCDIAGRDVDQQWMDAVVSRLGLSERLDHRPSELSGGQQQRVACARALVGRPAIIFGDEPTGNLDSRSSGEVMSILRASTDEFGQTVVIVTHDPRAASYADRVVFLADGQIIHELRNPDADSVFEVMRHLDNRAVPTGGQVV